jgi:hypothetical protein
VTETSQVNELLCKMHCYNLCVVIQSMYELRIEPELRGINVSRVLLDVPLRLLEASVKHLDALLHEHKLDILAVAQPLNTAVGLTLAPNEGVVPLGGDRFTLVHIDVPSRALQCIKNLLIAAPKYLASRSMLSLLPSARARHVHSQGMRGEWLATEDIVCYVFVLLNVSHLADANQALHPGFAAGRKLPHNRGESR